MAKRKTTKAKGIADYRHEDASRVNNPTAALGRDDTAETPSRTFEFSPHIDPQLVWAGKAEQAEIEVDAPSLHIHERISTEAILRHAKREPAELSLFADPELDRSKAVEFYEHEMGWANRLVLGDSLHVMTSLLERERLGGKAQIVYIDPPYGIKYNSNFQPRISDRKVKDGSEDSLTREPEMIQAYRDTWELGVHSYLQYMRERLTAARELLSETGSCFVQIGPDNAHLISTLMDEVFGVENRCPTITVQKTSGYDSKVIPEVADYLVWYARDRDRVLYHHLFLDSKRHGGHFSHVELLSGERRRLTAEELASTDSLPSGSRVFSFGEITSAGSSRYFPFEFEGVRYFPSEGRQWAIREEGMRGLAEAGRLGVAGSTLRYIRYADDFDGTRLTNLWTDTGQAGARSRTKQYVVETNPKIVERVIAMASDPGDLVIDPTCGSGTTAWAAEKHGRRWITIDTSRVALSLARERLLTSKFDYFHLADPDKGVDSGFRYKESVRVTASSIGYGNEPEVEVFYDQPLQDQSRIRVSGPFTVEALSRYSEDPLAKSGANSDSQEITDHVETLLEALASYGIPRRDAKPLEIAHLARASSAGPIQAEGTYESSGGEKQFAVSIGPRYGPITIAQVDEALAESPGYSLVCFVGFAATPDVQQYLAAGKRGKVEVALLEANADLLLGDLLKNTTASQTFRLFARPDATVHSEAGDEVSIELHGMDSYDAETGDVQSLGRDDIQAWLLDHDYDGTCFHVNQAFFTRPDAWDALGRALKETIDPDVIGQLNGFKSLPFKPGDSAKAAIRVINDAGQISEAILSLDSDK